MLTDARHRLVGTGGGLLAIDESTTTRFCAMSISAWPCIED
jgi:hypothetical protein